MKKILILIFIALLFIPTVIGTPSFLNVKENYNLDTSLLYDYDPLVDVSVTVEINKIRSFDKVDVQIPSVEKIDDFGDPDFYVKIFINEEEFISPIYYDTKYVYDQDWSATLNVPDDKEFVNITIQLWDWNENGDKICDISPFDYEILDTYEVDLEYSILTGHWEGDDYVDDSPGEFDPSGYGRLNGCDDGSIYQRDSDCELWFDIYQNDYDNDGMPYWAETTIFNTDPTVDDRGRDDDNDGVPIEWEYRWGHNFGRHDSHNWFYNPFEWDDHYDIDPDNDGLSNAIEYLMSEWDSDPFRKDVFVELDVMESNPDGNFICFPIESEELLYTAFNRQNVVLHLDSGCMGGTDIIPFDEEKANG